MRLPVKILLDPILMLSAEQFKGDAIALRQIGFLSGKTVVASGGFSPALDRILDIPGQKKGNAQATSDVDFFQTMQIHAGGADIDGVHPVGFSL